MTRRLLHVFSTFKIGGPQLRFVTVANALGRRYRHTILAMDGDYAAAARLGAHVDARLLEDLRPPKKRTLSNIRRFRRMLKEERPDLLLTSNWGAMEWALANRPQVAPHVHVEDGFGPEEAETQLPRRVWLRRLALAGRDVVVASRTLERVALDVWRLAPTRVRYIANGVEAERFARAPDAAFLNLFPEGASGPLIGVVCGLRQEKNLSRLLEAFKLANATHPARLAIAGDGELRAALAAQADALGLGARVAFLGAVDDPSRLLGAFDLFMLSSDTEQAPISILEAMAAGLTIVATDVGDIAQMVAPESRPYVVRRTAAALAEAATTLLADEEMRRKLGAANRARCLADFSEGAMIDAWRRIWDGEPTSGRSR